MSTSTVDDLVESQQYRVGFVTDVESETPSSIRDEDMRYISARKGEPGRADGLAPESIHGLAGDERT